MRRTAAALVALLVVVGLGNALTPAHADDEPVIETEMMITGTPEPDGRPVQLDASIWTTGGGPKPTIVLAHGFGGDKTSSAEQARTLARDGYTVITYTARGFGASGGRIHLGDPAYEGQDTRRVIDLAAGRPEVAQDGADPVVGFAGGSYGGAASLLAAGLDRRVDAIVPSFTWHSLTQALFPQYAVQRTPSTLAEVASVEQTGVFKQRWASLFFMGSGGGGESNGSANRDLCGRFSDELCRGYLATAQSGRPDADLVRLLARSSMARVLPDVTAPTLLVHGEQDTLFPLDQADANFRGLPVTTPAKMVWVSGGHDASIDSEELLPQMRAWFDRYLAADGTPADTGFTVSVPQTSLVGQRAGRREPTTVTTSSYPGRDGALPTRTLPLDGEPQTVINPPGGVPAAMTNLPGTGTALGDVNGVAGYPLAVLPGQSATFTTPVLEDPITLTGSGTVRLRLTPSGTQLTLFASLWDLGPDTTVSSPQPGQPSGVVPQTAVLPQLAVAPLRLTGLSPDRPVSVLVALPPVAHQVPVGHRLRVVVSSTDQAYATPTSAASYDVELDDATLTLPQPVTTDATALSLDVPVPLVVSVGLLALVAIAAAIAMRARQRAIHPRPELAQVPLVAEDLVKTYAGGLRAVDGVSFRAEPGQVVGLLGPNGAGKTTLMRMLVGLIRPDAGAVVVEGEPVHTGADVLQRVGAFIEGPGFLPHLTGRQNLTAFWDATGRPREAAHLEEALAVAGLGPAIERRVRGYSQGMRQRLGIAQAMLGRPSLLLLDEPTNGLDPPQIRSMRTVLADYAATGRTVVVSSHLLAEVEQTCTHVVVMHLGKVILTGSVAELTTASDVTMIGLGRGADLASAQQMLAAAGVDGVIDGERLRVVGAMSRSELVNLLVRAGFEVESVDGRRHLEDVFMGLVGNAGVTR